ncbi:FMRFamide-activated amiloride-sensitive sodium channel isoform X1, partial [Brachionus plicatilis]
MNQHRVASSKKESSVPNLTKEKLFTSSGEKIKEEDHKFRGLMKKCVKEWLENSSSHGFSNMIRADSWMIKIVWLILVFIFMAYCIFTVISIIMTYFKYEVVVSYKIISDSPSPFPAITICNLNTFDVSNDLSTGAYLEKILTNNSLTPAIALSENDTAILKVDQINRILRAYATSDKNLSSDDLKKKGFTIDTILVSCFYNNEECFAENFHWFRDNDFGNCYTFNDLFDGNNQKIESLKTSKSGSDNGLKMEIFVGVAGRQDLFTVKRGIRVVVHERGVRPLLKYDGIEVSTGAATHLAISRTTYSNEPPPYSSCRSDPNNILAGDSDYHKYTLLISRYSLALCYEICLQYEQIVPNCDCGDPSIPIVHSNLTICHNMDSLKCVKDQRDFFDSNKNIHEVCGKFCPNDCDQMVYSTAISQSIYPTDYYASVLQNQDNLIDRFNPSYVYSASNNRRKRSIAGSDSLVKTNSTNHINASNSQILSYSSTTLSTEKLKESSSTTESGTRPDLADLASSMLMISVFYDNLRITQIRELPAINFETMLGLIGGQFGLFMGASFLSFAEIFEM